MIEKHIRIPLELDDVGNFLSQFAENSDQVYWISSFDFKKIQYVSASYERIWGRSREELYANPTIWITFLHPEDVFNHDPIYEMADKIKQLGSNARYVENYRIIRPDGEVRWIMDRGFPLYDVEGTCYGVTGIATDVTEQKRSEESLRHAMKAVKAASLAKSEFIANMSHDLRTPLTGIIGMSNMLVDFLQNSEEKQTAEWLRDSGEQLLNMCNGILDMVSVENPDELETKKDCISLRETIKSIAQLEMPTIKLKNLDFNVEIDEQITSYVVTDNIKLHRILLNLLGNAIKFTKTGYVGIIVKLLNYREENIDLMFSVVDTGVGIAPELQAKIFDRFFRVNPSYKGIYKGNGLGLYIAQKYVQLLGGHRIYVESEEGIGSRFFFTLSFELGNQKDVIEIMSEHAQTSQQVSPIAAINKSKNSPFIENSLQLDNTPLLLLIEDNKPALLGLEALVKRAGYQFKSAQDGEKGVELAITYDFDLIISDIGLPGISGIDATRAIRAWEVENHKKRVPIIALTGHATQTAELECLQAGMDKVLTKPASLDNINRIIEQFISKNTAINQNIPQPIIVSKEKPLITTTGLGRDLPDTEEELFMLDQYLYFDMNVTKEIYGEDCYQFIDEFLEDISKQIPHDKKEIMDTFIAKDWDKIERLAHRIKSGAEACGTLRMKYACQYLERYRKAGHSKSLEKLCYQLMQIMDETKDYIDKRLDMQREV